MVRLGRAFGDMISVSSRLKLPRFQSLRNWPLSYSDSVISSFANRNSWSSYLLLMISFLLILFRLFDLQIINGSENRRRADQNRISIVNIPASRGVIYDRNGEVLARNAPVFSVLEEGKWKEATRDEAIALEAKGKSILVSHQREYPEKIVLSHVVGYTGEISSLELAKNNGDYKTGDSVGRTGIEKQYEGKLRGKDGKELIETDAFGNKLRVLRKTSPLVGENLTLTVSSSLAKITQEALEEQSSNLLYEGKKKVAGAVVVSVPATGEILAAVSLPAFDPNSFAKRDEEEISSILSDKENMPLLNRVISGIYPPGSTFKIITASAGLEERKITATTQIEDVGSFSIGEFTFPNWYFLKYGKKEGLLDIIGAIRRSNDIFFYKTAEMVGIDSLGKWMKKFNLGTPLGVDLPGEVGGVLPSDDWKRKNIGEGWYLGDTYHLGIGQGYLLTTPLQVNSWTSTIANGGKLCRPHLTKFQIPPFDFAQGKNSKFQIEDCKDLGLKQETIELIKEGMRQACETGGTGWPLFDFKVKNDSASTKGRIDGKNFIDTQDGFIKIPVACKTGTAEYGPSTHSTSSGQAGSGQGRTHAWFTAFAPADKPEISVTVLVEAGGEGSNVAAPVAKKILEYYFR